MRRALIFILLHHRPQLSRFVFESHSFSTPVMLTCILENFSCKMRIEANTFSFNTCSTQYYVMLHVPCVLQLQLMKLLKLKFL